MALIGVLWYSLEPDSWEIDILVLRCGEAELSLDCVESCPRRGRFEVDGGAAGTADKGRWPFGEFPEGRSVGVRGSPSVVEFGAGSLTSSLRLEETSEEVCANVDFDGVDFEELVPLVERGFFVLLILHCRYNKHV